MLLNLQLSSGETHVHIVFEEMERFITRKPHFTDTSYCDCCSIYDIRIFFTMPSMDIYCGYPQNQLGANMLAIYNYDLFALIIKPTLVIKASGE